MRKRVRKLNLNRETIAILQGGDSRRVAGGADSVHTSCECIFHTGCECLTDNPDCWYPPSACFVCDSGC